MKAKVHVFLKPGVLDVQGKAVEGALNGLSTVQGWANVSHVRVGKVLEFDVAATTAEEAKAQVKDMCDKLLANTVIESYTIEVA
ncbi:phosphoribosylformylglycinamidine synthase subunit PurS [Asticcacaulis machinosus]|uniref:Phosphoribosylformylglycinamidine synthase subunit PurS n=1 Tax=Asticcacaulis machinosus TaxID=2984211 RepID=A0ABT5HGF8_9CAUL|nr:phosphoribosylformylglycinamidine synthase subunit PurS [Asticcacaulis machinosus]MDC7675220.1 phosphoribosylformylglycinamidine synthase subunit PurS [Asticcacaulis machinosus]